MDPRIDDYIRENRARYTPQAIHDRLIAAGHDPAAIDEALQRADAAGQATPIRTGWRLGWRSFVVLVVLGAIGAGLIWQNQMYSAGGIAAVIYAVIAAIALGVGKGISLFVDRGETGAAAALLAVIGGIGGLLLVSGNSLLLAGVAVLVAGGLAAGLLVLRRANPARASLLGAAVPIVFWLAVTGTCYAPIFAARVAQPTTRAGVMELQIEPPLAFTGSGTANCVSYTSGFSINADDLGALDDRFVSVSAFTPGDPNAPASSASGERSVSLLITLNSPSGEGYATYGSPRDEVFALDASSDGLSGTVRFEGLIAQSVDAQKSVVTESDPISGTVSWTCE